MLPHVLPSIVCLHPVFPFFNVACKYNMHYHRKMCLIIIILRRSLMQISWSTHTILLATMQRNVFDSLLNSARMLWRWGAKVLSLLKGFLSYTHTENILLKSNSGECFHSTVLSGVALKTDWINVANMDSRIRLLTLWAFIYLSASVGTAATFTHTAAYNTITAKSRPTNA